MDIHYHIMGLQHLGLPTGDMEKTLAFYRALGFQLALDTENNGDRVCFLKLGHICIEAYEFPDPAGKRGAWDHVALDVDDIQQTWDAVLAAGYTPVEPEIQFLPFWEKGVRYFNLLGPNQETVEFSQML